MSKVRGRRPANEFSEVFSVSKRQTFAGCAGLPRQIRIHVAAVAMLDNLAGLAPTDMSGFYPVPQKFASVSEADWWAIFRHWTGALYFLEYAGIECPTPYSQPATICKLAEG